MANTSVSYDWGKLGEAATGLETQLGLFETAIGEIFKEVTAMGNSWTGPSYNAFSTYCTDYKSNTIDKLTEEISTWVTNLKTLAEKAQTTSTNNTNLFGGGQ